MPATPGPLPTDTQQRLTDALAAAAAMTDAGAVLQAATKARSDNQAALPDLKKKENDAQAAYNTAANATQRKGILVAKHVLRDFGVACPCHLNAVLDDDQQGATDPNM